MKAVLIFNSRNDIVFLHSDKLFQQHINEQAYDLELINVSENEQVTHLKLNRSTSCKIN